MGVPTVNQLALQLCEEVGESTSNINIVLTFERWIQEVFDKIGNAKRWEYTYSVETLITSVSARTYSLTAVVEQEISARYVDGSGILDFEYRDNIVNSGERLERTAKPTHWYTESYNSTTEKLIIGLFPTPSAIYSIEFFSRLIPTELTSSTKLPFPRNFINVLKDGVRVKVREDDKNWAGVNAARANFNDGLSLLKSLSLLDSKVHRLGVSDVSYGRSDLVRLPPEHFRN